MKRVAIIQARMTSTRLPGKVLADLGGQPMLRQQLRRLSTSKCLDEIVVATTFNTTDDPVIKLADESGLRWFRGDERDVLSRYVGAAREAKADVVVRITADCPLIDGFVIDQVVSTLMEHKTSADYVSNVITRSYPRGLDTEAFFRDTLERVGRLATSAMSREHVTYFIYKERPDLFMLDTVVDAEDNSDLSWTVDTPEDIAHVRRIYRDLDLGERLLSYREILAHERRQPSVS